jgi:RNA polymerase sigma-70 factor (ECF subfamily)
MHSPLPPPALPDAEPAAVGEPRGKEERFVQLLGRHQRRLFLYVMTLVPSWNDAEEILQETNLVLWREFDQFQPGTSFAAWACKVALHRVLAWRKRRQRDRLEFSDTFLEAVAAESDAAADRLEERSRQLARCIDRLPPHHRELLRLRYSENHAIDAIAGRLGRRADAVYRALSRIRHALHDCVTQALASEA